MHIQAENGDYPPNGLSSTVLSLPDWIKAGLSGDEYICEEKGATFSRDNMPDTCPDLTNHSSYLADVLRANPELYDQLKESVAKLQTLPPHGLKWRNFRLSCHSTLR